MLRFFFSSMRLRPGLSLLLMFIYLLQHQRGNYGVKNHLCIFVWVYFLILYYVLICVSNPPPQPHYLDCCSYIVNFAIRQSSTLCILLFLIFSSFFFHGCFSHSKVCDFPYTFRITVSMSTEFLADSLVEIALTYKSV